MNEPDLSFIKSDIDLSEVAPLNRRRVVALVNCFLYKMTDFLNDFANHAERSILDAERQLRSADIKLQLLEAKLAAIPDPAPDIAELQSESSQQTDTSSKVPTVVNVPEAEAEKSPVSERIQKVVVTSAAAENTPLASTSKKVNAVVSSVLLVKDDPAFAKYFKMLKLGVVGPAVKQKMHSEGVDPSLLDNPDAPSPNAPKPSMPLSEFRSNEDNSETSSVSSFTDSD